VTCLLGCSQFARMGVASEEGGVGTRMLVRIAAQSGLSALAGGLILAVLWSISAPQDLVAGGWFDKLARQVGTSIMLASGTIVFAESLAAFQRPPAVGSGAFLATFAVYHSMRALASSEAECDAAFVLLFSLFVAGGVTIAGVVFALGFLGRFRGPQTKEVGAASAAKGAAKSGLAPGRLTGALQALADVCSEWLPSVLVILLAAALAAHVRRPSLNVTRRDLTGKVAIVSTMGAQDLVGLSLASSLAAWGTEVVVTAPTAPQAAAAALVVQQADPSRSGKVRGEVLDLERMASVREFAARWGATPLHLLIHAAGAGGEAQDATAAAAGRLRGRTPDGLDSAVQVAYLSRTLLSQLLHPALEKGPSTLKDGAPSRIVHLLPSLPHPTSTERLPRLLSVEGHAPPLSPTAREGVLAQVALLTLTHTAGVGKELGHGTVLVHAASIGRVRSRVWDAAYKGGWRGVMGAVTELLVFGALAPQEAAAAALHAAVSPHLANSTALWFSPDAAPLEHCTSCAGPAGETFERCGESRLLRPLCGTVEFPAVARDAQKWTALAAASERALQEAVVEAEKMEAERVSRADQERAAKDAQERTKLEAEAARQQAERKRFEDEELRREEELIRAAEARASEEKAKADERAKKEGEARAKAAEEEAKKAAKAREVYEAMAKERAAEEEARAMAKLEAAEKLAAEERARQEEVAKAAKAKDEAEEAAQEKARKKEEKKAKKAAKKKAAEDAEDAEQKIASEQKQAADEKRASAEKAAQERRASEEKKAAEEQNKADEQKAAAERKGMEEKKRAEEAKKAADAEAQRAAAREKRASEEKRAAAEEKAAAEKRAEEEAAATEASAASKAAEASAAEERHVAAQETAAAEVRVAGERRAAEAAEAAEAEKRAAEEKRVGEAQRAAEQQRAAAAERRAAEQQKAEEDKTAEEQKRAAEGARAQAAAAQQAAREKADGEKRAAEQHKAEAEQKAEVEKKRAAEATRAAEQEKKRVADAKMAAEEEEEAKKAADEPAGMEAWRAEQAEAQAREKEASERGAHDAREKADANFGADAAWRLKKAAPAAPAAAREEFEAREHRAKEAMEKAAGEAREEAIAALEGTREV